MADESLQEKTEEATPRRLEESRKKGEVARSVELNSAIILFAGLLSLMFFSNWIFQIVSETFRTDVSLIPNLTLDAKAVQEIFRTNGFAVLKAVGPVMVVIIIAGILINFAQVGAMFSLEPITPKAEKFDFTKGAKRIFSKKTAVELVRDVIKVFTIGLVAFLTIKSEISNLHQLVDKSVGQVFIFAATTALKLGLRAALALFFLALLDFAFQKFEHSKKMRMSVQEVKQEMKELEGDPQIKARIKRIQRDLSRKRMVKEVETADVVVTNPTHIAVALRYDMAKDDSPTIVAMGERLLAEKIKEIAKKFNVPVVEDKPLARSLFELGEIGMKIPSKLYRAVAEVLAFVYKQKGKI
ncbi:MAG: flagellar biosynthesis protein FlhB [candidate division Zixibacteria bacterium]